MVEDNSARGQINMLRVTIHVNNHYIKINKMRKVYYSVNQKQLKGVIYTHCVKHKYFSYIFRLPLIVETWLIAR